MRTDELKNLITNDRYYDIEFYDINNNLMFKISDFDVLERNEVHLKLKLIF